METTVHPLPSQLRTTSPGNSSVLTTSPELSALIVFTQIFCILVLCSGVIGNLLVLVVFLQRWSHLKSYELFIVSLAVADMLGTIVLPLLQIFEIRGQSFHHIGSWGCKIIIFLPSLFFYVSSLTLIMVSIDRFIVIKFPLQERTTICRCAIVSTWLLGISGAAYYLHGDRIRLHNMRKQHVCRMFASPDETTILICVTFSIQTVVPVIVMTVLYYLIVKELYLSSYHSSFYKTPAEVVQRQRDNKKTTKLLIVLVLVFFLCVAPSNIYYLVYHFKAHNLPQHFVYPVYVVLGMLKMMNSCLNPIIYGHLHTYFRNRLLHWFSLCSVKQKKDDTTMDNIHIARHGGDRLDVPTLQPSHRIVEGEESTYDRRMTCASVTTLLSSVSSAENIAPSMLRSIDEEPVFEHDDESVWEKDENCDEAFNGNLKGNKIGSLGMKIIISSESETIDNVLSKCNHIYNISDARETIL